jgi:outer membrane receptor protein involved in Fe transport
LTQELCFGKILSRIYRIVSINNKLSLKKTMELRLQEQRLEFGKVCTTHLHNGGHPMSSRSYSRFTPPSPSGPGGVETHQPNWVLISALFVCLAAALFVAALPAWAQQSTGAIVGTVVDPTGAAVKGATIRAIDVDRGTVLTTHTDDSGSFDLPSAPAANYRVTVEAAGFQKAAYPQFALVLNQTARLNFQMKVGQVSESVEVTATAPILQTDTSLLGSILDSKTAQDLPLSTHNTNQLTLIAAPGIITPNLFGFQAAQNTFGTGRPYVNGAREQENNFILDGMDNNQPDNNDVGYVPSPEAIQEFNLITGSAPADFGNYLGGVVNVTVKSGTNDFHGSLYEYLRRGGLDANSWQNNHACESTGPNAFRCGRDAAGNEIAPRPALHYDNFGVTFGGPIVKNKLFFFTDYNESLFSQPATIAQLNTVPGAERSGNFSALCTAGFTAGICNNTAQQLYNPFSSANPAARTPFLNNFISPGMFNSAASAIINSPLYPANDIANNSQAFRTNSYQGDLKIDYVPSERDHVMGRWSQQFVTAPTSNSIELLGNTQKTFPLKNMVVDETHAFSTSLLNDARVGFAYFPVTEGFSNPTGQNLPAAFGIAGATTSFLPAMNFVKAGAVLPGTIGNNDLVQSFHDTTLQFEDTVTWTHGRHVIHGGFQGYHYIMNDLYPGNAGLSGQFTFTGQFTGNTGGSNGSPVADFLLGLPEDVQQGAGGGGDKYLRNSLFGVFGQDNWRIKDNLTLNLGLRWETITARTTDNGQDVNFNLVTGVPTIGSGYNTYNGIGNFQPRLGLAWQPKWSWAKNTVVRAAYGISSFMEANGVNNLPYQNPPFVTAHDSNFFNFALPSTTLSQGFSGFPAAACTVAALQAFSPVCISGVQIHITNPNLRPAMDQQWNLSIQRQLGRNTSIQVGYVGNKIDHMSDIFIFNQLQLVNGVVQPGPFAQTLFNCNPAGAPNQCPLDALGNPIRPQIRFNDSSGIQRYNALQVTVAQRAWEGLQFQTNYTWSKCMSNSLGYFGPFGDEEALPGSTSQTGFGFFFQNAYNAKGDYGRCISDAAGLFNGYLLYDLPFGKGRRFGGGVAPVVNAVIGGWSLASNFTLHSGFALYPHGPDNSGTNSDSPRPNCVAGVSQSGSGQLTNPNNPSTLGVLGIQFLNPAAVSAPAAGTFGNCAAGAFRGPGLATSDLSIVKAFSISERTTFQFMTQFINVTNTPILGAPNTSGPGFPFGVITSSNPGRQVQFGLKLLF